MKQIFDILVVGGGHAGLEAVNIASQFSNLRVGLLTKEGVPIGSTPCNPAIGGVGKGQLVREIDLMGGLIGKLADRSSIQCRILNDSKGDAVKSTRFQVDKEKYAEEALKSITSNENISLLAGELVSISKAHRGDSFEVVLVSGPSIFAKKLIITVGTFFDGVLHEGDRVQSGGRADCKASVSASSLGINVRLLPKKFKTGTPPRLSRESIDIEVMEPQYSDPRAQNFSFLAEPFGRKLRQVACYKTHTNALTIDIVQKNKENSPMFNGQIKGVGPRYCPSIEDKAFRYPDKVDHHVFVEPEGLNLNTYYPNGVSTSLPSEVQREMIRSIKGMESADIIVPGYAVEYDVIDTSRLTTSLESIDNEGLYFAGQVNGTSGYEEAAGQGLVAGLNAAMSSLGKSEVIFPRGTSYLGVLIDDILSNKREEPYRLFTARAENRLFIREDNVVERLGKLRLSLGLNSKLDYQIKNHFLEIRIIDRIFSLLSENLKNKFAAKSSSVDTKVFLDYISENHGILLGFRTSQEFLISKKYEGYINRHKITRNKFEKLDTKKLDTDKILNELSICNECKELIQENRPATFFHLKKIKGIRPATLALISSQI
jgi:tRNA uridine 5-carboxymethylaminomethyl modification enzyme